MSAPWTNKHRPQKTADMAGGLAVIPQLLRWIDTWQAGTAKQRALLLHGPPGTGKTVSVEIVANERKLDLIEVNASDKRNRAQLERVVGSAAQQAGLFGQSRLILIDEVDGINLSEDRGAIDTLVKLIQSTQCPIILTANDPWNPKIGALRNATTMMEYKRLTLKDTLPYLKRICQTEGVEVDEQALRLIVDRNKGDMRAVMNDLQSLTAGQKKLTYEEATILSFRDRKESIFNTLKTIFTAPSCIQAKRAADMTDTDLDMLFEWIYENAPTQLTDPRDLVQAMDAIARADLYKARINRNQAWELMPYMIEMETAGVAMANEYTKPGWKPMKFPTRIQALSRTRKQRSIEKGIGQSIGKRCHVSSKRAVKDILPYMRFIIEKNPPLGARIIEWLRLSDEAVEYLTP